MWKQCDGSQVISQNNDDKKAKQTNQEDIPLKINYKHVIDLPLNGKFKLYGLNTSV